MADEEDEIDYMQEPEALKLPIARPIQGFAHLFTTIFALCFYTKVFIKCFSYNKDELFTGLFSLLFLWQGVLYVIFLLMECVFDLPAYFPRTWAWYYSINETDWVTVLELMEAYIFASGAITVGMMAVERLTASFDALATVHNVLEKTPRILILLLKLIVPAIPVRSLYGIGPAFFAFDETQTLIRLFTMHHGKIQTDNIGPYIIVSCVVTVTAFILIGIKIVKNCGKTKMTDDLRRTILMMILMVPQLTSGGFARFGQIAREAGDIDRATFICGNLLNVTFFFVLTGPLVIFLSARGRGGTLWESVVAIEQKMKPSTYAAICAIVCGLGNLVIWGSYYAAAFISESVLHSVNGREPDRVGAHDGYYGLAVSNAFYMLSTIAVPSLMNYFRSKWILALSGSFFTVYYLSFQLLNRYLYFAACAFLGCGFSTFNIGYSGYLTEFSTRQTIERSQALSWAVSSFSVFSAGVFNFIVTTINLSEGGIVSKYREYSDSEIRYSFAALALLGTCAMAVFSILPNRQVEDNIAASNIRCKTLKEQLTVMFSVLFSKRVLILGPFYIYVGMFFSFWSSIIPTTLQFTKALSVHVHVPAYFGITFTVGSVIMSMVTMKMSTVVRNFSFKPLMIINLILHILIYSLTVCLIPQWSTVRPNDEPSLLIQPSIVPVLVLAVLCGMADAANNTCRTVLTSLLFPTRRQQAFGASRFFHGLAGAVLFLASPALSVYSYAIVMSILLVISTVVYLYTCSFVLKQERKITAEISPSTIDNEKLCECLN